MYQKIIKKYKGTTLVEIMVALAITSFAMTMGVVIYLNIQQSTVPFFKIKAGELGNKCLTETIETKDFLDKEFEDEGFFLNRKVLKNPVYPDCYDVSVKIFDATKKKLAEFQTTVYAE